MTVVTTSRSPNVRRTVVWRHLYRGRLRWANPSLVVEETPERIVSLLVPGTVCKAPIDYGRANYVQQLLLAVPDAAGDMGPNVNVPSKPWGARRASC